MGKIRAINRGTDADAVGNFVRCARAIQSGEFGTPRAFIGCFITGHGNGRKIKNAAFGVSSPEEQQMAVRRLQQWLEEGSK